MPIIKENITIKTITVQDKATILNIKQVYLTVKRVANTCLEYLEYTNSFMHKRINT